MTENQLKELQHKNTIGVDYDKVEANVDSSFHINAHEQHLTHVTLQIPGFSSTTGEELHKPALQMFYPDNFKRMEKDGAFKGQKVVIVHDPELGPGKPVDSKDDKSEGKKSDNSGDKPKPIERMNKPELVDEYTRVFNRPAPDGATAPELKQFLIEERDGVKKPDEEETNEGGEQ